jgi:hypothetical protein
MQTTHNIYLFMASFYRKYAIYIVETEPLKEREGEGVRLSKLQNIAESESESGKNRRFRAVLKISKV